MYDSENRKQEALDNIYSFAKLCLSDINESLLNSNDNALKIDMYLFGTVDCMCRNANFSQIEIIPILSLFLHRIYDIKEDEASKLTQKLMNNTENDEYTEYMDIGGQAILDWTNGDTTAPLRLKNILQERNTSSINTHSINFNVQDLTQLFNMINIVAYKIKSEKYGFFEFQKKADRIDTLSTINEILDKIELALITAEKFEDKDTHVVFFDEEKDLVSYCINEFKTMFQVECILNPLPHHVDTEKGIERLRSLMGMN